MAKSHMTNIEWLKKHDPVWVEKFMHDVHEDALTENIARCQLAIENAGDSIAARAIAEADIDLRCVFLLVELGCSGNHLFDALRSDYDDAVSLLCDFYA